MELEDRFEKILGSVSKEKFRQNANKLLNECFILKECTDTKNCYYFILKEKELYITFFDLLGYDIVISEEYGMIAINNSLEQDVSDYVCLTVSFCFSSGLYILKKRKSFLKRNRSSFMLMNCMKDIEDLKMKGLKKQI